MIIMLPRWLNLWSYKVHAAMPKASKKEKNKKCGSKKDTKNKCGQKPQQGGVGVGGGGCC